jgi:hypothetical protein
VAECATSFVRKHEIPVKDGGRQFGTRDAGEASTWIDLAQRPLVSSQFGHVQGYWPVPGVPAGHERRTR